MHGQIRPRSYDGIIKMHETPTRFYERRKLGRNTYSTLDPITRVITIRYHNTDVIKLAPNGLTEIYMGGYPTITTRQRMNAFMGPWSLYQRQYVQYLQYTDSTGVCPYRTAIDSRKHYVLRQNGSIIEGRL